MNLLERYLATLGPLLPRRERADISREIADEIESQMEEKASALKRPLTEQEEADVIRRHGHPVVVAARYGQPRYLIGPGLFPFYWRTLKVSLVAALTIWVVVIAVGVMASPEAARTWASPLSRIPGVLVTIFGVITGLFAVGQWSQTFVRLKLEPGWDPRSLPNVRPHPEHRGLALAELLGCLVGMTWWQLVPSMPWLALGPAAQFLRLGQVWQVLHWPVLALIAASCFKPTFRLLWRRRNAWEQLIGLLLFAAELVLLSFALRNNEWVAAQPELAGVAHSGAVADALNRILSIGCFVALLVRAVQFIFRCIRSWREWTQKSGVGSLSAI